MSRELETARLALHTLTGLGAQVASAQAQTSRKQEFTIEGGRFTLLRTTLDHSLALQAVIDRKRGVVSGNSFEEVAVRKAAEDCVASARAAQADPAWELSREGGGAFTDGAPEADLEKLFERTKELLDAIHREFPKIVVEQVGSEHVSIRGAYRNSHGVQYETLSGRYGLNLIFSGHEGEQSSSFNFTGVLADNLDQPFLDLGDLRQSLLDAENQIHTQRPEGKYEGRVIFTPACLGGMLGELLSNYASDGVLLDGTSLWKNALGTKVADERLTLSASPRDRRVVCGERFTPEGFPSENYDVIRDGVLKQFMLSAYAANKTGKTRAPNRSFALIMKPGDTPLAALIAATKKGLLVSRYSGGAAGASGEFSGVAKNSFLIEDGRVGPAVSETMISGNLAGMLNRVAGISRETVEDGTGSLPWLAVDGITISGK